MCPVDLIDSYLIYRKSLFMIRIGISFSLKLMTGTKELDPHFSTQNANSSGFKLPWTSIGIVSKGI